MPIVTSQFQAPFHLRNPHLQTMWPALMRKQQTPLRQELFITLRDGDELLLEEVLPSPNPFPKKMQSKNSEENLNPIFILFHGLGGSSDSQYIVGIQNSLAGKGIISIAVNSRGAKKANLTAKAYHGGSSDDIADAILAINERYPNHSIKAVGFSINANALLKYLAENPSNPLTHATAISVPFQLEIAVNKLDQGFSKVYRKNLLNSLREQQIKKHHYLSMHNKIEAKHLESVPFDKHFKSFWDYDGEIVAPIHGFNSAAELYQKSSSRQFLGSIKTPTHILQAADDPFMTKDVIPTENELSEQVTLEISPYGGHVGFFYGANKYYTEEILKY